MSPLRFGLKPCIACQNIFDDGGSDDNPDWKVCTGHKGHDFASVAQIAKQLSEKFGCNFFVSFDESDELWSCNIYACCMYSILEQIDDRIMYDHINHHLHYVGEDPPRICEGTPFPETIQRGLAFANAHPECSIFLCSENGSWAMLRSCTTEELVVGREESRIARIAKAEEEFDEMVEYIEAGAYDKSIGREAALAQASRNYRRSIAMANGGKEADAWKEWEKSRPDEDCGDGPWSEAYDEN